MLSYARPCTREYSISADSREGNGAVLLLHDAGMSALLTQTEICEIGRYKTVVAKLGKTIMQPNPVITIYAVHSVQ